MSMARQAGASAAMDGAWLEEVLAAAGLAAYEWDLSSGKMIFSPSAAAVLQLPPAQLPLDEAAFQRHLEPDFAHLRKELIVSARGDGGSNGHPFVLEYRFLPQPGGEKGAQGIWLRERGLWQPDADGRPTRALGVLERLDAEQHALGDAANTVPLRNGLMDRCTFLRLLKERLESPEDAARGMALLLISVRNLSVVADAYGFLAADAVYREVGWRIKQVLRLGDPLARFGDGRFAVLLHHCGEDDVGPALRRLLSQPTAEVIETDHGPMWPMLSIGAALLPQHANTLANAIACAEEALAEAEARPASNAVIYTPSPDRISRRAHNARRAHEILQALKESRFTIAFQPIVDAQTGQMRYCEALLRMRDAGGEIVSAGPLISLAEKLGLIHLLDLNVLELVIRTLAEQPAARLSCNVSGITVMDENWQRRLLDKLAEHRAIIRGRLMVEITESAALSDLEVVARFIEELHGLGCKVAVDDFGAGYTSFRSLRQLDFDVIKIDGAFCEHLSENEDHRHLVRSLVELAHGTGMEVVAEWISSEADAALLREWGVQFFQGHLYGAAKVDDPWPSPWLDREWNAPILPVRPLAESDNFCPTLECAMGERLRSTPAAAAAAASPTPPQDDDARDGNDALKLLDEQIRKLQQCLARLRGEAADTPTA